MDVYPGYPIYTEGIVVLGSRTVSEEQQMNIGKLRRSGNSFIVTVPRDEVERLGLVEGQLVTVEVRPVEVRPMLSPDLGAAFDVEFERGREALRFLAEH